MKTTLKVILIVAVLGLAAYAGQDLIINTARLDGFIYGNLSGGVDTLAIPDADSLGQFQLKNIKDPSGPLDAVNYRTLISGGGAGLDSIPFNPTNGNLDAYFGGVNFYTTNLDDRYIEYGDTLTIAVTQNQLADSLAIRDSLIDVKKYVYTITLPISGTLAGSIAAMTSSDNPYGWTFTANGTNLEIQHDLGRSLANVTVKYNSSGTIYRALVPHQTAYNTFEDEDLNNATIISISNFYSQYELKVHLTFD